MLIRKFKGFFGSLACLISTMIITAFLFFIIWELFVRGLPSLTWYFLFTPENETPGLGQGIANAVIGTILISSLATLIATPLGIGTAVYLQRYAKKNRITETFRFLIEVLSGIPSIVIGIFGLLTFVYIMKVWTGGFSLISGAIALSILIVPVIVRSVENAIESVPHDLEEGSYALGANKWQTIKSITLPVAFAGITTGIILAFGRAAEESAVVILTAGYSQFMPEFAIKHNDKLFAGIKIYPFQDLVGTLPYSVYHAYINSNVVPLSAGFAAAFILVCIVLLINILAKIPLYINRGKNTNFSLFSLKRINCIFSRFIPYKVPAAEYTAAELTNAERESAISKTQTRTTHHVPVTPSPISTKSEPGWKETLSAGLKTNPVTGGSSIQSSVPSDHKSIGIPVEGPTLFEYPNDLAIDPLEELHLGDPLNCGPLLEDDPVLLSDPSGADPGSALAELESAFTPDYPLLGEDPDTLITESPADEPWRWMTRNRLENTIAGITADPGEEP